MLLAFVAKQDEGEDVVKLWQSGCRVPLNTLTFPIPAEALNHLNPKQVLPLAFVAKQDEEKDVAELWGEVWEDATSGTASALRLYIADIVPLVTSGVNSKTQQFRTRNPGLQRLVGACHADVHHATQGFFPFFFSFFPFFAAAWPCCTAHLLLTPVWRDFAAGLASQQWGRKRCVALAVAVAAEAAPDAVAPHAATLADALQV